MKQKVLVFTTGGTIEKSYSEADGSVVNRESQIKAKLLAQLRLPYTDIQVTQLMAKDSLDMTEEDRRFIADSLQTALQKKQPIVVLHGTDTLEKTLEVCFKQLNSLEVPILFTGAMRPAGFDGSDALQNFTEALYASQVVDPGLYVSFHGKLFKAPRVRKNHEIHTFESY